MAQHELRKKKPGGGPYGFSFASSLTMSSGAIPSSSVEESARYKLKQIDVEQPRGEGQAIIPDKISKGTIGLYGASRKICLRTKRAPLVLKAWQCIRRIGRTACLHDEHGIDRNAKEHVQDIM